MPQRRRPARMLLPLTSVQPDRERSNTWMTKNLIVGPGKASTHTLERASKRRLVRRSLYCSTVDTYFVGACKNPRQNGFIKNVSYLHNTISETNARRWLLSYTT